MTVRFTSYLGHAVDFFPTDTQAICAIANHPVLCLKRRESISEYKYRLKVEPTVVIAESQKSALKDFCNYHGFHYRQEDPFTANVYCHEGDMNPWVQLSVAFTPDSLYLIPRFCVETFMNSLVRFMPNFDQ